MNTDIAGGLKNALDHGSTLEQAVQSFINAGYSTQEVQEASEELKGVSSILSSPSAVFQQVQNNQNEKAQDKIPDEKSLERINVDGQKRKTAIILILVFLIFLSAGLFIFFKYGESILSILKLT